MVDLARRALAGKDRRVAMTSTDGGVLPLEEVAMTTGMFKLLFGHGRFNQAATVNGPSEAIFKPANSRYSWARREAIATSDHSPA